MKVRTINMTVKLSLRGGKKLRCAGSGQTISKSKEEADRNGNKHEGKNRRKRGTAEELKVNKWLWSEGHSNT